VAASPGSGGARHQRQASARRAGAARRHWRRNRRDENGESSRRGASRQYFVANGGGDGQAATRESRKQAHLPQTRAWTRWPVYAYSPRVPALAWLAAYFGGIAYQRKRQHHHLLCVRSRAMAAHIAGSRLGAASAATRLSTCAAAQWRRD